MKWSLGHLIFNYYAKAKLRCNVQFPFKEIRAFLPRKFVEGGNIWWQGQTQSDHCQPGHSP